MCPIPVHVIEKSCRQVEDLFQQFLKIPLNIENEDFLPKKQASESNEVQYESFHRGPQRDSAKRLSSGNDFRTRGTEADQSSHELDIRLHRRSLDIERYNVSPSVPPPPAAGAPSAPTSGASALQRDSRSVRHDERMEVDSKSDENVPPTEEQLREAAFIIAGVGDQIERQYRGKMHEMRAALTQFIQSADNKLSYESFAVHINGLVGDDRDWTNFMFMMHLSRRVLIETSSVGKSVANYFQQYLGAAFAEQVAQRSNVVEFVSERPSSL